jgi:hypothetical protein
LYLYGIKIETSIKQNLIKKNTRESNKKILKGFFGLGRIQPSHFGLGW